MSVQPDFTSAIESAETFAQYLDSLGWTTDPLIDITQSGRSDEEHIKVGGMVKYVKPIDFGRVHSHLAHFDTDGRLFKRTLPRTGQLVARISANEETVNITAEYTDGGNRADYSIPFVGGLLHIGTGYGDLDEPADSPITVRVVNGPITVRVVNDKTQHLFDPKAAYESIMNRHRSMVSREQEAVKIKHAHIIDEVPRLTSGVIELSIALSLLQEITAKPE